MAEHPTNAGVTHNDLANSIRFLAMDAVERAKNGHPGMPMGMADVATVLYQRFLSFDPRDPHWPNRDRFVLSNGHGSMLLYALLYLTGYPGMTIEEIKNFRELHSKTPGHPEYLHTQGVETTTGPLGQGLATAVGMAIAERLAHARHGEMVEHFTYAMCGDGCLMEGVSHEAISLAGHLKLSKLILMFDDNSISIDGATSLSVSDDQVARFKACGWNAVRVDGHDPEQIAAALTQAQLSKKPTMIACKTVIGFGAPTKSGTQKAHGSALGAEEIAGARRALGWHSAPFEIPGPVLAEWRSFAHRGIGLHQDWARAVSTLKDEARHAIMSPAIAELPATYEVAYKALLAKFVADMPKLATRQASQAVLNAIVPATPQLIGGSADLTESNLTIAKGQPTITPDDFAGTYIHYGIREFGMAAAMTGIALYGGFIPYGGTFLCFSDYSRPAIRLGALMGVRVIHVMTHDSIGLGADGPTHQPVEHYTALRAIPNLLVFRPADAVETAEAWDCALRATHNPSVLCLTRQALPAFRKEAGGENLTAKGGYVVSEPDGKRDVTLLASGSEVSLCIEAAARLAGEGVHAAVVSLPSFELFGRQSADYRAQVLGTAPRVGVEAGVEGMWPKWLGDHSAFIGMHSFGASAPAEALFKEFGITADAVVTAAKGLVKVG